MIKTMKMIKIFLIAINALALSTISNAKSDIAPKYQNPDQILAQLKKGGYVIYLRHHATRRDQEDTDKKNLKNCKTQRNLSDAGRKGSEDIGKAFLKLGIKVSSVVSSPYCRCIDTAKLAFKETSINEDLHFSIGVDKKERERRAKALRMLLDIPPTKGTNSIIVSHTANLKEAKNIWPKPEGVMHIFLPRKGEEALYIGKIDPSIWKKVLAN